MSDRSDLGPNMSFLEHLEELRQRLLRCIVAVLVGIVVAWVFREELRRFLEAPLYTAWRSIPGLPPPQPLNFTSLMEPFVVYLKIAAVAGVFFASPVIFYQLWKFISPGLYPREKRLALPFVFISSALFIVGAAGAYTYVFPIGFSFFLQFSSGGETAELEARVRVERPHKDTDTAEPDTAAPPSKDAAQAKDTAQADAAVPFAQAAYQWLRDHLRARPCDRLEARTAADGSVEITLRVDAPRCPPPAQVDAVRRDGGAAVALAARDDATGSRTWRDTPPPGTHTYRTTVVRTPAHKLVPVLMMRDYVNFALRLLLAFGLVFELPILIFFLAYSGIVSLRALISFGRWFIVAAFVVAAILTPPDVVTQVLLALPLIVLYYGSIAVVWIARWGKKDTTP